MTHAHQPGPYTFGAMSLGADGDCIEAHIAVARQAMEAGLWFHASPTYNRGFSFMALRCAFDEAPSQRPPLILKIRDGSARWLRFESEDCCRRLGVDGIDIAQLVAMDSAPGNLADQLAAGSGPILDELLQLRERGIIRQVALYLDRHNDQRVAAACAHPCVDAVIGYWNCWQLPASDAVMDDLRRRQIPLLALRTLGGAGSRNAGIVDLESQLLTCSGRQDLVQVACDLAASEAQVVTTIGGTANGDHLAHFIACSTNARPLPAAAHALLRKLRAAVQGSGP